MMHNAIISRMESP